MAKQSYPTVNLHLRNGPTLLTQQRPIVIEREFEVMMLY